MTISLLVMGLLGLLASLIGWPMLLAPGAARRVLRIGEGLQYVYVLRIVGAMLGALGLILIAFAGAYAVFAG